MQLNRIAPRLPQNIVSFMFHLHASLELYQHGPNLAQSLDQLLAIFPTSSFLLTCSALLTYHGKDLITAEQQFSQLLSLHPHRLDSLDHYSNILYVLNLRPKLGFLAHLCSNVDKFRPESCVVVGNYYSLLSSHDKAVQYFRRALTLDRSCLSAWTLMGHEYVELKNTHAAIESYRRAVDVNRRDYRAWYGLGQTYEVLEMHTYALWYYKKAAGLRPWDGKMWMAVGSCFQKMGRDRDGIKALKRALLAESYYDSNSTSFGSGADRTAGHMDPEVLLQIANMYDQLGEKDEAKAYMELCMAQEDGEPAQSGRLDCQPPRLSQRRLLRDPRRPRRGRERGHGRHGGDQQGSHVARAPRHGRRGLRARHAAGLGAVPGRHRGRGGEGADARCALQAGPGRDGGTGRLGSRWHMLPLEGPAEPARDFYGTQTGAGVSQDDPCGGAGLTSQSGEKYLVLLLLLVAGRSRRATPIR